MIALFKQSKVVLTEIVYHFVVVANEIHIKATFGNTQIDAPYGVSFFIRRNT